MSLPKAVEEIDLPKIVGGASGGPSWGAGLQQSASMTAVIAVATETLLKQLARVSKGKLDRFMEQLRVYDGELASYQFESGDVEQLNNIKRLLKKGRATEYTGVLCWPFANHGKDMGKKKMVADSKQMIENGKFAPLVHLAIMQVMHKAGNMQRVAWPCSLALDPWQKAVRRSP